MSSAAVTSALAAYTTAATELAALDCDRFTHTELLEVLSELERVTWRMPTLSHRILGRLQRESTPAELGGTSLANALSIRLRISPTDASRRVKDAAVLGPRTAFSGEPMPPELAHTAAAQIHGHLGPDHVKVIREFIDDIPAHIDHQTREESEQTLARVAATLRPDQLRKAADRLMALINPDGDYSDDDRARKRGITIGTQDTDGMSKLTGWLTPQARATFDAITAKGTPPQRQPEPNRS